MLRPKVILLLFSFFLFRHKPGSATLDLIWFFSHRKSKSKDDDISESTSDSSELYPTSRKSLSPRKYFR